MTFSVDMFRFYQVIIKGITGSKFEIMITLACVPYVYKIYHLQETRKYIFILLREILFYI